jgi:signal transduction histidine kinase
VAGPLSRPGFPPRSLQGQILLAIALALFIAQGISAALIWRAQQERATVMLVNSAAFRLLGPTARHGELLSASEAHPRPEAPPQSQQESPHPGEQWDFSLFRARLEPKGPLRSGERRLGSIELALSELLAAQGMPAQDIVVVERDMHADPLGSRWLEQRRSILRLDDQPLPSRLIIASIQRPDGTWLTTRLVAPGGERHIILSLFLQTLFLYIVLVGAVALIVRRITRPLAALTRRVEEFARDRTLEGQLSPSGPDDIRRLFTAHNAMETRIAGLLDEKDVMLGAIGHDLKTPLAALRVRIESVENDADRAPMAAGIEDINRTLDDILSLARVGRPTDPLEPTELGALVGAVVDEYEDMGEPVTLENSERIVLPVRATWLRRALRNLASNAVRYAGSARVTLRRETAGPGHGSARPGFAVLVVEDDGPGIAEADVDRMVEPFTRLEASRNTGTGGAGIGLTLARAIAEQHGGSLTLANRRSPDGKVVGLTATIRLPL